MSFFATEYTIRFDDTMAYGSHHFLTAFKFQCAARESYLFGERIFDVPGVRDALDQLHLITADAYSRNLSPAKLGDRVAILLTIEEWGRASVRFCYRAISAVGQPICAGFQTMICADPKTGNPIPAPPPLWSAMEAMREIEERQALGAFRDRVLAGGSKVESLFGKVEQETAIEFLAERYPSPKVVPVVDSGFSAGDRFVESSVARATESLDVEAWVFAGQGSFDPRLLSKRIAAYEQLLPSASQELDRCAVVTQELIEGDASALFSGSREQCGNAVKASPELSQVAIHLQNVLGALLRQAHGHPPGILMGHSFGEIAALGVSGCFDLPTGVRIVCERVRALAKHAPPDGGLLVVSSNRQEVATEAALLGLDQVMIAGRNHEQQTVASGPRVQLNRLREYCQSIDINAASIPSPTSFHHPQLRPAAMAWLERLNSLPLCGPSHVVYSPIGRRFISPDDDVAAILASQFLRPFDLQGAITDAIEAGATKLVDCGSTGSLARIISATGATRVEVSGIEQGKLDQTTRRSPARSNGTAPTKTQLQDSATTSTPRTKSQSRKETDAKSGRRSIPTVAIVGQGCLLPGGADSPRQLYSAITEQRMGIVDQRRFDAHWSEDFYSEKLVPDRSTSYLTGRVNDDDLVPPVGVDAEIFAGFTRAQRLLCIALAPCIASIDNSDRVLCLIGATADGFEDQDVVSSLRFAGIDPIDKNLVNQLGTPRSAFLEPLAAVQEVFDRIVRPGLDVTLIDAACASSLYAVALGTLALETNRADVVIAGGVFCPGPGNSCLFSQFHGTTATGCRPFDANADGVVFSEGSALVSLRRVEDAERLGLQISAIVRGAGLSSDGRSSSANVPQSNGQLLSLERCYANYDIDPASIQAIEGHGTSTPVGDSTELETLKRFFTEQTSSPIPLHSLKGLLGHAGWAAGTASVIAASEYLRTGVFPAQACHREPSDALVKSVGTLSVPTTAVPLPTGQRRIAIDGFGFGGANAHLVLDSYVPEEGLREYPRATNAPLPAIDDELVFVAYHELVPTQSTSSGLRFDRERVKLSAGHVMLPDLADDIDICQTLAISLVDELTAQIPKFDKAMQRETGVVLAQSGKTARGVEATMRVLAQRLQRKLAGLDRYLEKIKAASDRARPSGPYTLQGMMPNVSSGRAALQLNLNGPNFVVDSGSNSLEAAMSSASLLLHGGDYVGTKLVIVAAIYANPMRDPLGESPAADGEIAAAFAVTTRRYAEDLGLKIASDVQAPLEISCGQSGSDQAARTTASKARTLIDTLDAASRKNATATSIDVTNNASPSKYPIHAPAWVEAPLASNRAKLESLRSPAILAIVPANREHVAKLTGTLPQHSQRCMVVVVGPAAKEVAAEVGHSNVVSADLADELTAETTLKKIDEFGADVVVTVESITSWDSSETLTRVAKDNSLCELLFLVAQRNVGRLKQGAMELWGLFPDAWDGVVHPASGAVAGLLKAVVREIAATRIGVICTRDLSLGDALKCLLVERLQSNCEQEVVYDGTTRLARRLRQTSNAVDPIPQVKLDANSVVVVTGGARGVTAVLLDALLRRYQCRFIALGRSELEAGPTIKDDVQIERSFYDTFIRDHPDASPLEMKNSFELKRAQSEAHHTIQQLSSLGRVEYMVADVTDREQVASVVQQIASKFGRIDLLVHGAGVQSSKRLEHRSLAEFRKTFSVKVAGLRHLVDQCREHFGKTVSTHLLTSAYSIFGNDGQHDYGAANETLDRLCGLSELHDDHSWSSIAWLAWDGVGMTRGSEYHALAKQRGLSGLDTENGQRIFREVLAGQTKSSINVPISESEHVKYGVKTIPPATKAATGRVVELVVELSKNELLQFHKVRNTPTLPGACILERMVNAGLQLSKDAELIVAVTIQDATFHRFVRFSSELEPNVRVVAEETTNGVAVWMIGDVLLPTGVALAKDIVLAQAKLHFETDTAERETLIPQVDADVLGINRIVSDPYCDGRCTDVELSGPFDCVRDISIGPAGRRARFVPNSRYDFGVIPTLLLDSAMRVGAMHAGTEQHELCVPVRIGRLVVPVGKQWVASSAPSWEIRATVPSVEDRNVRSHRAEVLNETGAVKLVIEDALATRIQ